MSQTDTAETTANRTDGQEVSTTAGETVEETRSEWTDYAAGGETKLAVEDLDVHYGDDHALKGVSIDIPEESDGAHRPVWLWKVDVPPVSQSDERPYPSRQR